MQWRWYENWYSWLKSDMKMPNEWTMRGNDIWYDILNWRRKRQ